jgi:hypothetical protein
MNSFSRLFQEVPDFGEILLYAVIVTLMVIGVVIGRVLIRAMVNRRVRGIQTDGFDLADLSAMGQKGLLTEEELKLVRKRFAERQLQEVRQAESAMSAKDLLLAIEADPSRATSLLPPSSEHAKRALEGLKKSSAKSVEDQLRAQLGEPPPDVAGGERAAAAKAPPETPVASDRPSTGPPKAAPAEKPAAGSAAMDLDAMLAKGLISRREYDLLMSRIRKASGE